MPVKKKECSIVTDSYKRYVFLTQNWVGISVPKTVGIGTVLIKDRL